MKLIRFGNLGQEKPGVELDNGQRLDVSGFGEDFNGNFFSNNGIDNLKLWLENNSEKIPIIADSERLGCPIDKPSKIVCIGLNYTKHAEESGMTLPEEPVLFFKSTTAIVGPYDDVMLPKGSLKSDWEVELAVVMGKKAAYVHEKEAMDYVAGYVIHNDLSEREFQLEHQGQWVKGKSCDTFAPLGPYLVTKDEVTDPHNLDLWLKLNGKIMQSSNTSDMVFNVPKLISYISRFMTLLPGDILSTGTPFGVGLGLTPPVYLKAGDIMELGIDGLGVSRQKVIAFKK